MFRQFPCISTCHATLSPIHFVTRVGSMIERIQNKVLLSSFIHIKIRRASAPLFIIYGPHSRIMKTCVFPIFGWYTQIYFVWHFYWIVAFSTNHYAICKNM